MKTLIFVIAILFARHPTSPSKYKIVDLCPPIYYSDRYVSAQDKFKQRERLAQMEQQNTMIIGGAIVAFGALLSVSICFSRKRSTSQTR
jgi:hypothetical protein